MRLASCIALGLVCHVGGEAFGSGQISGRSPIRRDGDFGAEQTRKSRENAIGRKYYKYSAETPPCVFAQPYSFAGPGAIAPALPTMPDTYRRGFKTANPDRALPSRGEGAMGGCERKKEKTASSRPVARWSRSSS